MVRLRDYLPNTSGRLALVHVDDERPFRAYWPMRFTQIIGGKRWSLSVCWRLTDKPAPVPDEEEARWLAEVRREAAEQAWGEGYLRGTLDATRDLEPADNPYRKEEATDE